MTAETKSCAREGCDEILARREGEFLSHWNARRYHDRACPLTLRRQLESKVCAFKGGCNVVITRKPGQHRRRFAKVRFCSVEHGGRTGVPCPDGPQPARPQRVKIPRKRKPKRVAAPPPAVDRPVWRPNAYGWTA